MVMIQNSGTSGAACGRHRAAVAVAGDPQPVPVSRDEEFEQGRGNIYH